MSERAWRGVDLVHRGAALSALLNGNSPGRGLISLIRQPHSPSGWPAEKVTATLKADMFQLCSQAPMAIGKQRIARF